MIGFDERKTNSKQMTYLFWERGSVSQFRDITKERPIYNVDRVMHKKSFQVVEKGREYFAD